MNKKNVKGSANKAIGLSLLAVTAASMTPVIAPNGVDNAYAAPTKAEATALAGAVELNGPAGSDNYKDDVAGQYWYTKSGSFKVTVDDKKYSGVKIEVNGQEVLPPTQVTEAKTSSSSILMATLLSGSLQVLGTKTLVVVLTLLMEAKTVLTLLMEVKHETARLPVETARLPMKNSFPRM